MLDTYDFLLTLEGPTDEELSDDMPEWAFDEIDDDDLII